MNDQRQTPGKA